ncbi:MAG: DUF4132 domain-containing protein [Sandaracinus sp.]|nr:DUF4132 domain-containing protein [Sandaracinus sp.]
MSATWAIDPKKKKAQSEDSATLPKRVPLDRAMETLFVTRARRWNPVEASDDTRDALAFLERFVADAEARESKPDEDGLDALFAYQSSTMSPGEFLSLFFEWCGPEWLLQRALGAGRYAWSERGVFVRGGKPLTHFGLTYTLMFLRKHAPKLVIEPAVRAAKLPLTDRTRAASFFENAEWASELADEWLAAGIDRRKSWEASVLLGLIDDPARFERFVAAIGDQMQHVGANARLGRLVGRLPAEVVERVFVGLLDRGLEAKWKSSNVEPYAKALFHVKSPEVARVLAAWMGEKSVAKVATDYFRAHPELADAALGPVAKRKGKAGPIAKALLESIARAPVVAEETYSDAAPEKPAKKTKTKATSEVEAPPEKAAKRGKSAADPADPVEKSELASEVEAPPAKAKRGKSAKGASAAKKPGGSVTLPDVLVSPPWAKKRASSRPKLALEPIVENESFTPKVPVHLKRPAENRSAEKDAEFLGRRPPLEMYEGAIWNLTDEVALRALRDRPKVDWTIDAFVLWLGDALVPLAIRSIAANLQRHHTLLSRARSSRLALDCAFAARQRTGGPARLAASAWLSEHPELAAIGLVPAALGPDDLEAEVAERTLRDLVRAGHGERVTRAAARYGDAAKQAIDALLTRPPEERFPAKLPTKAKWALPDRVGTLELSDGTRLTEAQGVTFVQMLQFSPLGDPYVGVTQTLALATDDSREALAKALFSEYLLAGSPPSHDWIVGAIALLSPKVAIASLKGQMRLWAADGKVPLLHRSLEALAEIGTDEALVVVYDAGQRSRYDDTRDKVRDILDDVARARGISYETLEDRLVPELGLEDGAVSLDLGGRTLSARLGDHLETLLFDDAGKTMASFPRKAKGDDTAKYDAAKARYATLVEASDSVGRGQVLRLERALRDQRSWSVAELRENVLPQPLLRHLARRLVWQVVGTGTLFRIAEDLTLADANDEMLAYPPSDARVVLAHPVRAPTLSSFTRWLEDYRVIQPFAQVGREVCRHEGERFDETKGREVGYLAVLGLTLGMGWKPVAPGEKGIDAITREVEALDGERRIARLEISPGLLFGGAKGRPAQTLGELSLCSVDGVPARFEELEALTASELLRDVVTLS